MSYFDYRASLAIAAEDYPFSALIMAAMRKADSENLAKLQAAYPETWAELRARYHTGGVAASNGTLLRPPGLLPGEPWHVDVETDA